MVGSCSWLAFVAHAYEGELFFMDGAHGAARLLGMGPERLRPMCKYGMQHRRNRRSAGDAAYGKSCKMNGKIVQSERKSRAK